MDRPTSITGVVLAGGRGSRMGGADKGLLQLHGHSLAEHALQRLRPQVDTLLLCANRNRDAYAGLGATLCSDADPNAHLGPLAGIASALAMCATPWLLCVPCDSPHFPTDLGERLLQAALAVDAPIAMACSDGQAQPVFCLLRRDLLRSLNVYLEGGGRRVRSWAESVGCVDVNWPDPALFINVNAPADLARLAQAGHRMI